MVDVLLITPPFSYGLFEDASPKAPSLGLATVASMLEKSGYGVKIIDLFAEEVDREELKRRILEYKPKIVGMTSVTANCHEASDILEFVKGIDPGIVTIYGGPHVTIMPELTVTQEHVDYGVIGEGDYTAVELVDYILKNEGEKSQIKGICYTENGEFVMTETRPFIEDLDELPLPAYHLLPMHLYKSYAVFDVGRNFSTMITSRGCPFRCIYCTSSKIFGHRWRAQSPKRVLDEIKLLYEKYKVSNIYFQDDEFTVSSQRTEEICNGIIESGMDIVWECLTRVSHVKEPLLKKMAEAGCKSICYGIETGYEEGIEKINKKITLEQARDAVKLTKKHGMIARVTFMMGLPWESKNEIKKTIKFAKSLDADITYFNTLNPYPGTKVYDEIEEKGLFADEVRWENYVSHGNEPTIRTQYLTNKELSYWNGRAYLEFYLRPKFLLRKISQMKNIHQLKRNVKAGIGLLKLGYGKIKS